MTQLRRLFWYATFATTLLLLPLRAAAQSASLSVTPNSIASGGIVTVSGTGLPASSSLVLWLDTNGNGQFDLDEPAFPLTVQTDANGLLAATFWAMNDIPAGSFPIQVGACAQAAAGLCLGTTGVAHVQLTVNLGVSRSKFGSGTTVSVTGFGFAPSSTINLWYDSDVNGIFHGGAGSATPSADPSGAFTTALLVNGGPGDYFIHASSSTSPQFSVPVNIGTCWFQECLINDQDTICILGNSPTDLEFLPGVHLTDCKVVNTDYSKPTPITQGNNPPGGYDLNNHGALFPGAGLLAAATNDLGLPGTGCIQMTAAILAAELPPPVGYGNSLSLRADADLVSISCVVPLGIGPYVSGARLLGRPTPDADLIGGIVLAVGGPAALPPAQTAMAEAAVAAAIACGYVDSFCYGSDITSTVLEHPALQANSIPLPFLQPPIKPAPIPNPCVAVGVNGTCWGDVIGWAIPVCHEVTGDFQLDSHGKPVGVCERADTNGNYPKLPVPGSAGPPDNTGADIKCATGTVTGLSIGYDGDLSFDVNGPDVLSLVNYHNLLPGPGGTEPPNGIDVEIPIAYRGIFQSQIDALRPGMTVHVCGRWVADMHMLWNELHPMISLSIGAPSTGAPLTVTADNKSRAYGAADPTFTVSYSGFLNSDTKAVLGGALACATSATSASPVGNYPIMCSGQTSDTYTITYLPGTLAITPAPLSIAANNATRPYGASDPPFTSNVSGLLNGDTLSSIGVSPICTTSATAASPVGAYPITCNGLSPTTNYAITYSAGTLTITQAALTVTANNATRLYGSLNPAFTVSTIGLVNGDTLSSIGVSPICTTSATAASPVGAYPITCNGLSSTTNYAITYSAGTLTITQAALTVTANNATRLYGSPGPAFTVSTSGLVNGDTLNSIGATPTCSTPATAASPVGSYAITCIGPASTTNYTIAYQSGALSVTPAPLTITANNVTNILHAANPPLSASYSGFVNGETPAVLIGTLTCTTTATTASNVGSYPITCSGQSSTNYAITYVAGTLKIFYATAIGHVIQPPINADGSSVFKQGRTIPAKFAVYDANGVSIGTPGVVSSFFLTAIVSGTTTTVVEDVVDTNNPDTVFRWDGQQWIFNITTGNLSAGNTYVYSITLNDGSTILLQYGLR